MRPVVMTTSDTMLDISNMTVFLSGAWVVVRPSLGEVDRRARPLHLLFEKSTDAPIRTRDGVFCGFDTHRGCRRVEPGRGRDGPRHRGCDGVRDRCGLRHAAVVASGARGRTGGSDCDE